MYGHARDITVTVRLGCGYAASFPPLSFLLVLPQADIQTPDYVRLYRCPRF
jgi:hypothetical protein